MRTLHVTPYFAPAFRYGGPPRSVLGLCRALGRHFGTLREPIELLADPAELDHGLRRFGFARRAHRMLPASSKMGKYMSTTMRPITRPITVIMAGSISRVARSTKRDSSSS